MKSFRRILAVFACALMLVGTAVSPASAHSTHFIYPTPNGFLRGVACPHPYLSTPYGPLTICTSGTPGIFENRDVGYYSPYTNDFGDQYLNLSPGDNGGPVDRPSVLATDGIRGTFRGGYSVETAFGRVSYGIQYIVYLLQPIGRFGNYSFITGKFHPDPNLPWYNAEHNF